MDTSKDDSDSEEEIFVFADFKNLLDQDILKPGNLRVVKAIGMDSETPVIQLNNYFFQGQYTNCMGTHLLLEEDPETRETDPVFDVQPEKNLRYLCKTRKVLQMQRIFLRPKEGTEEDIEDTDGQLDTHASTVEEALQNFQTYFDENDCDLPLTKTNNAHGVLKSQKSKTRTKKHKLLSVNDISEDEND